MTTPPVKRYTKPGYGEFLMADDTRVVDEHPQVLASRLPLWLTAETPRLRALDEQQMRREWARRCKDMDDERAWRATDATRRVA